MNVVGFFNKLRKMDNAEIRFRLHQRMVREKEQFIWRLLKNRTPENLFYPEFMQHWTIGNFPLRLDRINFFGFVGKKENLKIDYLNFFEEGLNYSIENADRLLNHKFHFLGLDVELPEKIIWNRNPQTGVDYPVDYYANLNVSDTKMYGDIKYLWELNRHQFFIELGKVYFLTGKEKYAEKVCALMEDWIDRNPYKIGVNWTSALEAAMRIFSWIWAYAFTSESPEWTNTRKEKFIKTLLLHGAFIEENLSYYYSPYNHLVGELAALAFLGTVYPYFPKAKEWRDKYWLELENQIEKQFHPDGMSVEQASYYHHFTLGFYLLLAILRNQNGLRVSSHIWKKIENTLEFSMGLTRPDGKLPMIGDIDNARSIYFYFPSEQWDLRYFLALGAVLFKRADMKFVAGKPAEELLWLFGNEGLEDFWSMEKEPPRFSSRAFPQSGYFIMRDGWGKNENYCCFDCGEIADGLFKDDTPSAAHGHADILSFELSLNGKPLVIDPGFNTYYGDIEWHRYYRSTKGHNCVIVNGKEQAISRGRLNWSNISSPRKVKWLSLPELDIACGEINKFAESKYPISHRRNIIFIKSKYFILIDEVFNRVNIDKKFFIESFLHFSPGELKIKNNNIIFNNKLVAKLSLPPNVDVFIEKGGSHPTQGWISKGYGYKEPAPILNIKTFQNFPTVFGMLFPTNSYNGKKFSFNIKEIQQDVYIGEIDFGSEKDLIYINPKRKRIILYDSIETNAFYIISIIITPKRKAVYLINLNRLKLIKNNKLLINKKESCVAIKDLYKNPSNIEIIEGVYESKNDKKN